MHIPERFKNMDEKIQETNEELPGDHDDRVLAPLAAHINETFKKREANLMAKLTDQADVARVAAGLRIRESAEPRSQGCIRNC